MYKNINSSKKMESHRKKKVIKIIKCCQKKQINSRKKMSLHRRGTISYEKKKQHTKTSTKKTKINPRCKNLSTCFQYSSNVRLSNFTGEFDSIEIFDTLLID